MHRHKSSQTDPARRTNPLQPAARQTLGWRQSPARFPLCFVSIAALLSACHAARLDGPAGSVVRGPLPTRIAHPLALASLAPASRRAQLLPEGRAELLASIHHASLYEDNGGSGERVTFDGEISRPALRWRYGVDERNEFELEVAGFYASSGFLDHFVTEFHQLTHFADGGRSGVAEDQFSMFLRKGGERIWEVEEDALQLADVPMAWVHQLQRETSRTPAVAIRLLWELPLGSPDHGAGNGRLDYGLGILAEKSFGRFSATAGLDWVHPERPKSFVGSGVELSERLLIHHGWEYRWNERNSLFAQATWMSRLTSDYAYEEIRREMLDVGLGWAHDLGPHARWLCSLNEDAVAASGPDVSFFAGLLWQY